VERIAVNIPNSSRFGLLSDAAETSEPLPSKWISASVAIPAFRRCLSSRYQANGYIRQNVLILLLFWRFVNAYAGFHRQRVCTYAAVLHILVASAVEFYVSYVKFLSAVKRT
jgi:hypothetical protein